MTGHVQLEPTGPQHPLAHVRAAQPERADPGHQLGEGERLDEVVVGATFEAVHPVGHLGPRGEHQRRRGHAAKPQPGEPVQRVAVGHPPVQHQAVVVRDGDLEVGVGARRDVVDDEPVAPQPGHHLRRELVVVLQEQHLHAAMLGGARRAGQATT